MKWPQLLRYKETVKFFYLQLLKAVLGFFFFVFWYFDRYFPKEVECRYRTKVITNDRLSEYGKMNNE